MSLEDFNENKERSVWNLFQKKNLRHPEMQEKGVYSCIKQVDIERNPPNSVIRPLLVRPQAREEPTILWREKKKRSIPTNASRSSTSDNGSSSFSTSNESRNEEFNKWKQFIFAYAQDMYNLSRPPSPPTKLRTPYFIPPRPFNEGERIAV